MKESIKLAVWTLCVVGVSGVSGVQGSEPSWLQWGGPNRDFRLESASLATAWPEGEPRQIWSRPLGEGYSAIVVDGGALYTMHRDGDDEVVVALDTDTGKTRWRYAYRAPYPDSGVYDYWRSQAGPGPYSTPLIVGTRLFTVGVGGQLHALDRKSGGVLWSRHLREEFDIAEFQGYAPSPIAHGGNVILPVGAPGQAVVAFDQETGKIAWKNQDLLMAPASPILIDVDGQEQLVVFGRKRLAGIDPGGGALLWSHPHETEYGLNISTPVWGEGNLLFCSSAYNGGSRVIRLRQAGGQTKVEELWFNNRMRIHWGNALRVGDLVLGTSGDFGPAFFAALDVETGEEVWRERSFARSHMVYADGKIVIVDEDGEIAVATPTDEGLEVHARAGVLKENAWTPPTLVGSRLYVRDRSNILALELGQ
jgi:outer membrane protein assembly factor BamB